MCWVMHNCKGHFQGAGGMQLFVCEEGWWTLLFVIAMQWWHTAWQVPLGQCSSACTDVLFCNACIGLCWEASLATGVTCDYLLHYWCCGLCACWSYRSCKCELMLWWTS
jgi:hypothetical protein